MATVTLTQAVPTGTITLLIFRNVAGVEISRTALVTANDANSVTFTGSTPGTTTNCDLFYANTRAVTGVPGT